MLDYVFSRHECLCDGFLQFSRPLIVLPIVPLCSRQTYTSINFYLPEAKQKFLFLRLFWQICIQKTFKQNIGFKLNFKLKALSAFCQVLPFKAIYL